MKRILITAIAAIMALSSALCHAAKSVPYSSELGTAFGLDPDWTNSRGDGPKAWSAVNPENWQGEWGNTGCSAAIQYSYAATDADAWFISPAIALEADKDYTLTVWVRTDYFSESFRVNLADSPNVADLKAGTTIADLNNRTIAGRWKPLRSTFRVDHTADYHFGLNCYSKADQMNLYVTGFSLAEGDGSHEITVVPAANPQVMSLPYRSDIAADHTSWSSIIGSFATSADNWYFEPADNSYSFVSYDNIEDNWLISPALRMETAGDYRISISAEIYGSLDVYLGTDPARPETFTIPVTGNTDIPAGDDPANAMVEIPAPGTYYVGFHAHAKEGSSYGYGITSLYVREYKDWPKPVDDLASAVDPNGAMEVTLGWTNPSLSVKGNRLEALEKVEIYRDSELIATLTDAAPGQKMHYTDSSVPTPGLHIYHILPYNALGAAEDGIRPVSTTYVGTTVEPFPYRISSADSDAATGFAKWYAHNPAGVPDREWHLAYGWRYYWESRQLHNNYEPYANDDYLATPYITMTKGYYNVTFSVVDRHANYDFGYLTDRADMPSTFVKVQEMRGSEIYNEHTVSAVVYIPADGNYAMAWHHVGTADANSGVEIYGIDMTPVKAVPSQAENLTVTPGADFALTADISWTNPTTDNAGMPLDKITRISVLRNGESVEADIDLTPGASQTITDRAIPADGEYVYQVIVLNDNGALPSAPPSATVYAGRGAAAPWQADLWTWKIVNMDGSREKWRRYGDSSLVYSTNFNDADDWAISPYITFEPESRYEISAETYLGGEESVEWALAYGTNTLPATMTKVATFTTSATDGQTDRLIVTTVKPDDDSQRIRPAAQTVYIPSGTYTLALHGYTRGTFELRSFAVNKDGAGSVDGIASDLSATVTLSGGMLRFPANTVEVKIFDAQGRYVASQRDAAPISADALPRGIVMVTVVTADGAVSSAKFAL